MQVEGVAELVQVPASQFPAVVRDHWLMSQSRKVSVGVVIREMKAVGFSMTKLRSLIRCKGRVAELGWSGMVKR